jgi:glycosyltransferase involved in cell wall biosynthesis
MLSTTKHTSFPKKEGGLRLKGIHTSPGEHLLVSIITVVYNGEKYLEETILSVLNQTYPNIEYIIIDGGSTDNTVNIIKKYEHLIDYWVSEKDKGISDAFNKGITLAKGDIIGIINADDWYEKDAVQVVISIFKSSSETQIVCGKMNFFNQKKCTIMKSFPKRLWMGMSVAHPTTFVKKELYNSIGLFNDNLKFAMDYAFLLKSYYQSVGIFALDHTIANMRSGGSANSNRLLAYNEVIQISKPYKNHIFIAIYYTCKKLLWYFILQYKNKP